MPHDRFYGIAAEEVSRQEVDKDLFARAYAIALGDPEKTKAIYIGIRAERLEELAEWALQAEIKAAKDEEARARKFRAEQEIHERETKEREAKERAAKRQNDTPILDSMEDAQVPDSVKAMREALKATKWA